MKPTRRRFLKQTATLLPLLGSLPLNATENSPGFGFDPSKNIIPVPSDAAQWPEFREALAKWRAETKSRLRYSDTLYRRDPFAWASSNYACGFLMLCDQTFYDPQTGRYKVDSFLEEAKQQFGGYDSVVLWHAYPRIGVDERNQFDFYRDLPGGLTGVRELVHRFQQSGVRVYIDYNPWDVGTRREAKTDLETLVELVRTLDVDGIFLDTMSKGATEFRARLDAVRPGVILEGEDALPLENLHDHHASWAQWFEDSPVPGVLRLKWLERRHMQHQIRRWDRDHTGELQVAWMNGSGTMIWENVFGSWVPWNARDRGTLRTMLPIQRRFTSLFQGEDWTPLVSVEKPGLFASLWEDSQMRLWTLVNRTENTIQGRLLRVSYVQGHRYFDLLKGKPVESQTEGDQVSLSGEVPSRSIGCFLSGTEHVLGADFSRFLIDQARRNSKASLDTTTPKRETKLLPGTHVPPSARIPKGMVEIPAGKVDLWIEMRVRECGFYESMLATGEELGDCYNFRVRQFQRCVDFKPFAMDEMLVTNGQFADFLKASEYEPRHKENFLKHWTGTEPPRGKEEHPVVYVDLDDARAFAKWAGKRLPSEEEWQYAAQGNNGRKYPWGAIMEPGRCNGGENGDTTPVSAFLAGRSPFGCYDMCGNVWQWTESERSDGRTRFCIIRGGSFFAAKGSGWYVDGGPRPVNFATKFLLMWPGLDRCSTIGFRCAVDLG